VAARRGFRRRICAGIERGDNAGPPATTNLSTPAGQPTTTQTLAFVGEGGSSGVADSLWRAGGGGGSRGDARNDGGHGRREAGCSGGGGSTEEPRRRQFASKGLRFPTGLERTETEPNQTNNTNYLNQIKPLKASNQTSPI
jgi:hypothetical protein